MNTSCPPLLPGDLIIEPDGGLAEVWRPGPYGLGLVYVGPPSRVPGTYAHARARRRAAWRSRHGLTLAGALAILLAAGIVALLALIE